MCGIAGILSTGATMMPEHARVLRRMSDRLVHRGPDAEGLWISEHGTISLAHRRLSILDLSEAGAQPMASACGRFVLVFNGEIYNHLDLRRGLEAEHGPIDWRGHSDTETLLVGIERWGLPQTLCGALGMFALGLWDQKTQTLSLARDRMGEKPLFLGRLGKTYVFASELPALLVVPGLPLDLDHSAIASQLATGVIPDRSSVLKNVTKIRPGSVLTIAALTGSSDEENYESFQSVLTAGRAKRRANKGDATERIEAVLTDVVASQMISDVPLGSFLSGGVDSSLVTALMQQKSDRAVRTFSIGFSDVGYDESGHAEAVAEHLGTDHQTFRLREDDALGVIPDLARIYGEPFADSSQIPTLLLAQQARKDVTVALTGDGGDEVFGGYNRYIVAPRVWDRIRHVPRLVRRSAKSAGWLLERAGGTHSRVLRGLVHRLGLPASVIDKSSRLGAVIADSAILEDVFFALTRHHDRPGHLLLCGAFQPARLDARLPSGLQPEEWMMAMDSLDYLPSDILTKVDRASMSASLETRAPFLDRRTIEAAWSLDLSERIRGSTGKAVLREILYRHVPRTLIERPKQGFAVPIDRWLRGPLYGWASDLLSRERLHATGVLDPNAIDQIWSEHVSRRINRGPVLWSILMLQQWLEEYCRLDEAKNHRVV